MICIDPVCDEYQNIMIYLNIDKTRNIFKKDIQQLSNNDTIWTIMVFKPPENGGGGVLVLETKQ